MIEQHFNLWQSISHFVKEHPLITAFTVTSVVGSITGCIASIHRDNTVMRLPDSFWRAKLEIENNSNKIEIKDK